MKTILTLFVLFFSSSVFSEIVELQCKPENSNEWEVEVKISIEEKWMSFGTLKYKIVSVVNEYVTGVEETYSDRIGGEIWVQNRVSGEYFRAAVANYCTKTCNAEDLKVNTSSYKGVCKKKLF